MEMTSKEFERILDKLTHGNLVTVGRKTVITVSNYQDEESNTKSSYYSIFDYDTPICEISARLDKGMFEYTGFINHAWRCSPTTVKHTKHAILLVLMAIQVRFGEFVPYDEIMEILDNSYPVDFMGF